MKIDAQITVTVKGNIKIISLDSKKKYYCQYQDSNEVEI